MEPFLTTHWSLVVAARDRQSGLAREALNRLCSAYWYPIYAYIRRRGHDPETASDLTQGYFTRLLETDALENVDPSRGKFRAFLLASCKHFLSNQRDYEQAQKRGGGRPIQSIDDAEGRYRLEPSHEITPEALFDRRFALILLENVLDDLRQDFARRNKSAQFEALKSTLTGSSRAVPYAQIAIKLQITEAAVQVAVHRLRSQYRKALRARIAETVIDPNEIEDEIRALFATLAK